jgi:hypothetical protein
MTEPSDAPDLRDDEYMTPQQRAELRRLYALPLWQPEETITDERLAEIELHRRINKTVGQEPEE